MAKSPLKMFRTDGDEIVTHFIDTKTDGTSIEDMESNVLMEVDSDAYCKSVKYPELNGKFRTDANGHWYHKSDTGVITKPINNRPFDLLLAERDVFFNITSKEED
jgi:hypothetical protein